MKKNIINNLAYFDDLKIVQNKDCFNFSLDSVLLPYFAELTPNTKNILDLCTGNAPVPLILSTKTKSKIIGIEIQKEIYKLAIESVKLNNLSNQIEIINDDVKNIVKNYETDSFDLILCNPPYFKASKESILNNELSKSIARHELLLNLDDIIKISKKLLKNGASLTIVHRTDRIIEIIDKMKKNNIEPKRMLFIYPKVNKNSNIVLIDGRKNGKVGLKLLPPLFVHDLDGNYTEEILKAFGREL
ncbi:MAG: tRNA1(Val) (adenine(37)-N6)-methyltransferase [Tenericutes bacterium]|nr:tRNA1(Val) (adenine(37)-N6)-methyltransferase [Mycoplasmatota bacterium]